MLKVTAVAKVTPKRPTAVAVQQVIGNKLEALYLLL
jgi:hypothetical protein